MHETLCIDAYYDRQLSAHKAQVDNEEAEQEYLEDLERELFETGIDIGSETFCRADAELDWFESAEFDAWNQAMIDTDRPGRRALIREFESRKANWISQTYVPQLAAKLRREYEADLIDVEDVA